MEKNARSFVLRTLSFAFFLIGCQPAAPYQSVKPAAPAPQTPIENPTPVGWLDARPLALRPDVPIVFVAEKDPDWAKLPKFWNPPPTEAEKAAAALALFPGAAAPLAAIPETVRVKVPAGLDDPNAFLPADPASDPPTLNKWRLGRKLFYDPTWLRDDGGQSCASCHKPASGFADNARGHGDFNTPTLVNCVYNRRQFWDGRAQSLEEVVQRSVADETTPADQLPFHVWSGVVRRLRASADYHNQFTEVFGNQPTEDAVGKALATYLRTLLAADSIHDRALAAQKVENAVALKAEHYEKALDDAALKRLGFDPTARVETAKKIYRGYRLFYDLEAPKMGCSHCHGGLEFTDEKFHNLGVAFRADFAPGHEPGYFASLPPGRKDRTMIGAYKTPTLRGLSRTGPYFHDGSVADLTEAIRFHVDGEGFNDYIDPALRDAKGQDLPRTWDLPGPDLEALTLFLRSLEGIEVDPAVGSPPE